MEGWALHRLVTQRDWEDHRPGSLVELEEEAGHRGESKGLDQGSGMEDGSQDEQHHSLLCEADGARKQ